MTHFIKCTDGKEREIFPAKIKHRDKIRHFTTKFSASTVIANIMAVDNDKLTRALEEGATPSDEQVFDNEPYDAMMEMLILAFGEKYTAEQIEEFLDVEMIGEILDVFYGLSGYKKKSGREKGADWNELIASIVRNTSMTVRDIGEMSYVELEDLMDGMIKYGEREKKMLEGKSVEYKSANDLISRVQSGNFEF